MVLLGIQQTLPGVYEITPDAGSAFFLRIDYFSHIGEEKLKSLVVPNGTLCLTDTLFAQAAGIQLENYELEADVLEDILNASLCYAAELKAMDYLARAEQCRSGLSQKLYKKGFEKQYVQRALDYLESIGYLDDFRFAGAWLRNRAIDHYEGKRKLSMELMARGVDRNCAKEALDEFFSTRDEGELCIRALRKALRTKSDAEKIKDSLARNGFSYSQIKAAFAALEDTINNES